MASGAVWGWSGVGRHDLIFFSSDSQDLLLVFIMAGFVDVCSLILTSAFFIGVILGTVLIAQKCQALIDATKASLEERGWVISGHGAHRSSSSSSSALRREGGGGPGLGGKGNDHPSVVVVKTSKKIMMDHERYLDATQRGVIKAFNACSFGAPSSQSQSQSQTLGAGASVGAQAGPSSSSVSTSPSFGGGGGGGGGFGLSSTVAQFRSQLLLPPFGGTTPQPDQLDSSTRSGKGFGPAVVGLGGTTRAQAQATSPNQGGTTAAAASAARDSFYDMADRFSAWPSEKIGKAKRLRDQFLSKVSS